MLHALRLTGFTLGLLILLGLFALLVVGLPPGITRRITVHLQEAGIPLQAQSIHLSPHRGWVLKSARLYSTSPDDLQPLLTARKMYVLFWPVDWKQPVTGGWRIRLYVKSMGVSLGTPWENTLADGHPFRTIQKLEAAVTAAPGRIAIDRAKLTWGGIRFVAHGTVLFEGTAESQKSKDDFRRRAALIADTLSRLKCEQPPELRVDFNVNDVHPEQTFLNASLSAEGLTWRDGGYKHLEGALSFRNSTWTLDELRLTRSTDEQLLLRGTIDLTGSTNIQASIENTLTAPDLLNLLPEKTLAAVAQTGIHPSDKLDFTASIGPAPLDQIVKKADVQIRQTQLKWQDITLNPLALHLVSDGNRIAISDLQAKVNGGPLAGTAEFNLDSKAWTAHVQTQCDPSIAGIYDEALRHFIRRFNFRDQYPKANLTLSQSAPQESLIVTGTLSGDNFTCGGVPIDHLETFMTVSNQVVDLTPIRAVRDNEQFDGSVQVDFTRQLGIFHATNSFPPGDIVHALAPGEPTILDAFRFDGPVYAAGQGQIDYGTWTNHLFTGTFRAEKIGMNKFNAESFIAGVQVRATQLLFTNASAQLYNGRAQGSATFDISLADGSAPYQINANIEGVDLKTMLQEVSAGDYNKISGQLSTAFTLAGDAKTGFWNSAKGRGQVKIENGRLAGVPLFGGFSRLIQSAFAGFNLFTLTEFSADYQLHDRSIWSDNAQLGGTLISARGRGNYSPDKGLNFIVAAEPLRQTGDKDKEWYQVQRLAATATAPFLRLLEFQLSGPLEKPDWRFVNLPSLPKQ